MTKRAFAIGCHPDDIEFGMAGTLLRLKAAGYEIHYMNIANGALGTNRYDLPTIRAMRREESLEAARRAGAVYHESLCDDLEVLYNPELLTKLVPVIREVDPEILITHGPYDYMLDHVKAGELAYTAAFCRGMTNCKCTQSAPVTDREVAVYHSMPHSVTDMLRRPVTPGMFVDIGQAVEMKKDLLRCHRSQKEWLDVSQGLDAYLDEMTRRARYYGRLSQKFEFAEGFVRHNPLGFCSPDFNPLVDALGQEVLINEEFEKSIRIDF